LSAFRDFGRRHGSLLYLFRLLLRGRRNQRHGSLSLLSSALSFFAQHALLLGSVSSGNEQAVS